jgi:dTDP-4-amino-4,6-dideoxygalactose transaminase
MVTETVPFNDLGRQSPALVAALEEAALRVIRSGWFLLGPETDAFESEFAAFCGAAACVSVANGTDALELALRAVGCSAGDEVVVVGNAGMYGTTAALAIGAVPVFAEIDPATLLIDPKSAASLLSDRTAAVVATHLYGSVVDVDELRACLPRAVPIVEDCAQAHGASIGGTPVGSLGDVAAFSFYPTKNLGALGDAGAVVSSDTAVVARTRALRQYGWESRYHSTIPGGRNSRMDEIQAAMLRVLLPHVTTANERRAELRTRYVDAVGDRVEFIANGAPGVVPATHLCVTRFAQRDDMRARLADEGVRAEVHYPLPDHLQPSLASKEFRHGDLHETERACDEVLSLPCFPTLRDDEVERVVDALRRCT